ncbi:MAG: Holliday junction branch migration protein RuvA [Candidatus Moranbacteria bacterium]|jgi:Holliday junction DNA helicase RuvA|nr:Holliday junction branch migration protein RuvA [Candidatus Moranbacteria bacterium]
MIIRLEGKILMKGERFVALDVNGVSYRVFCGPQTIKSAPKKDVQFSLWTHLHVREDAMEIYGFLEYAELEFFEMLIGISGIGPKGALGVLAVAPLDNIKRAISSGETNYLTKVSGIGRKTAEKIVLELRDKLGGLGGGEAGGMMLKEDQDVLGALQSLGYSLSEAREAMKQIPDGTEGTNSRIKEALKNLGGK